MRHTGRNDNPTMNTGARWVPCLVSVVVMLVGLVACASTVEPEPQVVIIPSLTPPPTITPSPTPAGPPLVIQPVETLPDVLPADGRTEAAFEVLTRHAEFAGRSVRLNAAGGGEVRPQMLTLPPVDEAAPFTYITGESTSDIRLDVLDGETRLASYTLRIEIEPLVLTGEPQFPPETDVSQVPLQYTLARSDGEPLQGTYTMRVSVVGSDGLLLTAGTNATASQQQVELQAAPGDDRARARVIFQPALSAADQPAIVTGQLPGRVDVSPVRQEVYWSNIERSTVFTFERDAAGRYTPEAAGLLRWNIQARQPLCWQHLTADNRLIQPPVAALRYRTLLAPVALRLAVGGGEWPPDEWLTDNERQSNGQLFFDQANPTCAGFTSASATGGMVQIQAGGVRRDAEAVASVPVLLHFGQVNLNTIPSVQIPTVDGRYVPLMLPQEFHIAYRLQPATAAGERFLLMPLWVDAVDMRDRRIDSGTDGQVTLYLRPELTVAPLSVSSGSAFQSDSLWLPTDEAGEVFTGSLTINDDPRTLVRVFLLVRQPAR